MGNENFEFLKFEGGGTRNLDYWLRFLPIPFGGFTREIADPDPKLGRELKTLIWLSRCDYLTCRVGLELQNDEREKMAEIHFLLCFDTETKKWKSADEALGGFFTEGFVWDGDEYGEKGKWRGLNFDDPVEVELEYEATEQIGSLLKNLNGVG